MFPLLKTSIYDTAVLLPKFIVIALGPRCWAAMLLPIRLIEMLFLEKHGALKLLFSSSLRLVRTLPTNQGSRQ